MSNWIEDSAKVSIKEEFRDDFQSMLDGRFNDVENEELREILIPRYNDCGDYEHIMHILKRTEYNDGIFTFRVSFNDMNRREYAEFQRDLIYGILPIVVDYVFYHHCCYDGDTGPVEWHKKDYKGWRFGNGKNRHFRLA